MFKLSMIFVTTENECVKSQTISFGELVPRFINPYASTGMHTFHEMLKMLSRDAYDLNGY